MQFKSGTRAFDGNGAVWKLDHQEVMNAVSMDMLGGLAEALYAAVINPTAARINVVYVGPKPDLLKDEAQAIVTGKLGSDGVFHADELLLKCPTRYQNALPSQAAPSGS